MNMPSEAALSIVIVNWNSRAYVYDCVRSVVSRTMDFNCEIIVVDSGSFDGCGEMLQQSFPSVRFVQLDQNVGFARANNEGARVSTGRVLLFLNPDTVVIDAAVDVLYRSIWQLPDVGVIGCRLLNTNGSIQTSGVMPLPTILNQVLDTAILQRWFRRSTLWQSALSLEYAQTPIRVEGISGACMMITRDTFDRIGGFSVDYFMYAEDLDLCFKAMSSGLKNYVIPDARIVHHGGGSTKQARTSFSNIMMRESTFRLLKKTHSAGYATCYKAAMSGVALVRLSLVFCFWPAYFVARKMVRHRATRDKWAGIFRWGIGLERWVENFGSSAAH